MNDKLNLLIEKRQQLDNRIKTMQRREKEAERKERTRRLIQIGAIMETRLNIHTVEEAEAYCDNAMRFEPKP